MKKAGSRSGETKQRNYDETSTIEICPSCNSTKCIFKKKNDKKKERERVRGVEVKRKEKNS